MAAGNTQQVSWLCRSDVAQEGLAKGFCKAKFWAKFPLWRGVRGEIFAEVFCKVFGLILLRHSEQQKKSAKTFP